MSLARRRMGSEEAAEGSEPGAEETQAAVVTADDTVRTTDELVVTADETVESAAEDVRSPVVGVRSALAALVEVFGTAIEADYVPGKTMFRDELARRFDLAASQSEEMCDELERLGLICFVSSDVGIGWHLHAET